MLTAQDAQILLEIAHQAIEHEVRGSDYRPAPREEKRLTRRSGCFVTIKKHGQLRGCIGNFQARLPLFQEVAAMAAASATQDPRFAPVDAAELDDLTLEITVLSPLEKIENVQLIEIGKHGLYIEKGLHRGVLLPQVATEYGWDRTAFLEQTCRKAGLSADDWQAADAEIYIFSGQIIHEGHNHSAPEGSP